MCILKNIVYILFTVVYISQTSSNFKFLTKISLYTIVNLFLLLSKDPPSCCHLTVMFNNVLGRIKLDAMTDKILKKHNFLVKQSVIAKVGQIKLLIIYNMIISSHTTQSICLLVLFLNILTKYPKSNFFITSTFFKDIYFDQQIIILRLFALKLSAIGSSHRCF